MPPEALSGLTPDLPVLLQPLVPYLKAAWTQHLAVLPVIVPMVLAPLSFLINYRKASWAIAMAGSLATLFISLLLIVQIHQSGPVHYNLGGWAAPWGIAYDVRYLNTLLILIVSLISSAALAFALRSSSRDVSASKQGLFYTGWLILLTGLLGICLTGDAFNLFVFLEVSSLASYLLISLSKSRQGLVAAFQYLIMGTIGASFILISIGLLYAITGTLNIADLAQRLMVLEDSRTMVVAFAFLIVGVGIKAAIYPLHVWLPNAYTYAPSSVSVFLAGTSTKVAVYILLTFIFLLFGRHYSFAVIHIEWVLLPLAVIGIYLGSVAAISQVDVKRLLAFSSIAQIGYMVLGVALNTQAGITASTLHLFNHALIKSALFLAVGCMVYRLRAQKLRDLAGLAKVMPWSCGAFLLAGLSLIGLPGTAGFVSKWYLLIATWQSYGLWLCLVALASSLLAIIYIAKVCERLYFGQRISDDPVSEAPLSLLIPTWSLVLANVYFGLYPELPVFLAEQSSQQLLTVFNVNGQDQ